MSRPRSLLWEHLRCPTYFMAGSIAFGLCPLLPTLIAATIATLNGCRLHEGFPNPCSVCGVEIGDLLYAMGISFWYVLLTLPLGLLLLGCSTIWLLIEWCRYMFKPKSDNVATESR
jgi:hypothetical protein